MARPSRPLFSLVLFILASLVLVAVLVFRERSTKRPEQLSVTTSGTVDMCLSCHDKEKLDGAHDGLVIGCAPCHLGDPLAID